MEHREVAAALGRCLKKQLRKRRHLATAVLRSRDAVWSKPSRKHGGCLAKQTILPLTKRRRKHTVAQNLEEDRRVLPFFGLNPDTQAAILQGLLPAERILFRSVSAGATALIEQETVWEPLCLDEDFLRCFVMYWTDLARIRGNLRSRRSVFPAGFFNVKTLEVRLMARDKSRSPDFSSESFECSATTDSAYGSQLSYTMGDRFKVPFITVGKLINKCFRSLVDVKIHNIEVTCMILNRILICGDTIFGCFRWQELTPVSWSSPLICTYTGSGRAAARKVDIEETVRESSARRVSTADPVAAQALTDTEALFLAECPFLYKRNDDDKFFFPEAVRHERNLLSPDHLTLGDGSVSGKDVRRAYKRRSKLIRSFR
eukprot:TRINITY_DN31010_c0_g1_i4.p1 TRINITY_DN31010_c0_g1~~TRINITY_DN31010_c0_g1_i4.p1  ORF type:complete len:373 (+),score=67.82 TRINITY_DN31010_c0_g1_i4:125-1243(+)